MALWGASQSQENHENQIFPGQRFLHFMSQALSTSTQRMYWRGTIVFLWTPKAWHSAGHVATLKARHILMSTATFWEKQPWEIISAQADICPWDQIMATADWPRGQSCKVNGSPWSSPQQNLARGMLCTRQWTIKPVGFSGSLNIAQRL